MNFLSVLKEFQKFDCKEQHKCALACRVYLDLILGKRYSSVEKCYENTMDLLFLKAKRLDDTTVIVVPSLSCHKLDLNTINKLQTKWHDEIREYIFVLAVCDTSSNILYYELTQGFEDKQC